MNKYIDSQLLIAEVQKYELLYNTTCVDYRNNLLKQDAIMEITKVLVEKENAPERCWEKMNREERTLIAKEVSKRWKNIKDTYLKCLRGRKGKSYCYAKYLHFLNPFWKNPVITSVNEGKEESLQPTSSTDNNGPRQEMTMPFTNRLQEVVQMNAPMEGIKPLFDFSESWDGNEQSAQPYFNTESEQSSEVTCISSQKRQKVPDYSFKRKSLNDFESQKQANPNHSVQPRSGYPRSVEVRSSNSSTSIQSEHEADELFLMSLLPYMKKLNDFGKLDFKVKVMQLLRSYSASSLHFTNAAPVATNNQAFWF